MARPFDDIVLIWLFLRRLATPRRRRSAFRRLRQRERAVRERMQIVDHVSALLPARQPRECHGGPRNVAARVGQELVELIECPSTALGFHGGREVEAPASFPARTSDDVPQIWSDPVGTALFKGVARLALLRG